MRYNIRFQNLVKAKKQIITIKKHEKKKQKKVFFSYWKLYIFFSIITESIS